MFQISWLIYYIISFFLSFCLTYLYKDWAIRRSVLDIPNERSSHVTPVPCGGGIAFIAVFYLGLLFIFLIGKVEKSLFFALLPGIGLALVGITDDFKGISTSTRFTIQLLCSGIALYFLGGFNLVNGSNLYWLWSVFALFGFVWFINLFNFLDGSDGYAAMEAISIALAIWFFTRPSILLLLVFSIAGFLFWNWPKAKIFMGDSGSTTLGFILVVFGIHFHNTNQLSFIFWIILTALFWFDATFTLFRRILNKEKLSQAHKNHIYQRAIQGGFSHLKVLLSGLGINIILFGICLAVTKELISYFLGFFFVLLILASAMFYVDWKFAYKK